MTDNSKIWYVVREGNKRFSERLTIPFGFYLNPKAIYRIKGEPVLVLGEKDHSSENALRKAVGLPLLSNIPLLCILEDCENYSISSRKTRRVNVITCPICIEKIVKGDIDG